MSSNPQAPSLAAPLSPGRALPPLGQVPWHHPPYPQAPALRGSAVKRAGLLLPTQKKVPSAPRAPDLSLEPRLPYSDSHLLGCSEAPFPGEAALDSQRPLKMAIRRRRTPLAFRPARRSAPLGSGTFLCCGGGTAARLATGASGQQARPGLGVGERQARTRRGRGTEAGVLAAGLPHRR